MFVGVSLVGSNFAALAKQGRAPKTDGPRLRGASGVNVFKSFLALAPFIQRNGRDGCGPSVFGVSQPRGEQACEPQLRLPLCRVARVGRAEAGRPADQAKRDGRALCPGPPRRVRRRQSAIVAEPRQTPTKRDNRDNSRPPAPTDRRQLQRSTRPHDAAAWALASRLPARHSPTRRPKAPRPTQRPRLRRLRQSPLRGARLTAAILGANRVAAALN